MRRLNPGTLRAEWRWNFPPNLHQVTIEPTPKRTVTNDRGVDEGLTRFPKSRHFPATAKGRGEPLGDLVARFGRHRSGPSALAILLPQSCHGDVGGAMIHSRATACPSTKHRLTSTMRAARIIRPGGLADASRLHREGYYAILVLHGEVHPA